MFYVFLCFFWVTNFRPGYKTHVFYVFLCFFQSTKKMAQACVLCVFVFFLNCRFQVAVLCFFSLQSMRKIAQECVLCVFVFFSELLIVWAGYSCIDTVLVFLWYCDVGWLNIYRRGGVLLYRSFLQVVFNTYALTFTSTGQSPFRRLFGFNQ